MTAQDAAAGPAPAARRLTPRQRRLVIRTIQYAVFAAIVLTVALTANWTTLHQGFFRLDIARSMFPTAIVPALLNTVVYTVCAFVFGLVLGTVLALMRLSEVRVYRWVAVAYIEVFRGVPALLVLFLIGFGIPDAFPDREIPGGVYGKVALGLGLPAAAYIAEILRSGIQAVPPGQMEAGRTLGMSRGRTMVLIILPQAFRIATPALTNQFIQTAKDTSLAYVLGVTASNIELIKLSSDTMNARVNATPLLVAALMYLVITLPLSQLVRRLERRVARAR